MTEKEIQKREVELSEQLDIHSKYLRASTKFRLRMMIATLCYVERLRAQGELIACVFDLFEKKLDDAIAEDSR